MKTNYFTFVVVVEVLEVIEIGRGLGAEVIVVVLTAGLVGPEAGLGVAGLGAGGLV